MKSVLLIQISRKSFSYCMIFHDFMFFHNLLKLEIPQLGADYKLSIPIKIVYQNLGIKKKTLTFMLNMTVRIELLINKKRP